MYHRDDPQNGNQTQVSLPYTQPIQRQSNNESLPRNRRKWFGARKAVVPHDTNRTRNLNATFCEHTWDVDRIEGFFKNSRINVRFPDKSRGLSNDMAKILYEKNGPNILPKPKEMSDLELFLRQFLNVLWIVLLIAAILTLISYFADMSDTTSLWVTIILIVMIFVMCCISWYQEREARKVVRGFQNLLPERCTVIRDGMDKQIFASEIVVGDIIRIQSGVRVPADARILQCNQLKLETSSITGEPEPLDYHEEEVPENINIFESKNVAFNSSLCVDGEGVGVVIRTGINTVIGQIAELTTSQPVKKSRLEMQIRLYIRFLLVAALAVGSSVFLMGGTIHHWENIPMLLATSYAVCAVGMVPEGLPATVTSILTVIARRLEKKNVYLKRLDIVEALGSASIIATDKTGTLTKNVMTVTDVWYNNEVISGLPTSKEPTFTNTSLKSLERFAAPLYGIFLGMIVCNKATFGKDDKTQDTRIEIPHPKSQNTLSMGSTIQKSLQRAFYPIANLRWAQNLPVLGTPTDAAMFKYVAQIVDVKLIRQKYPIVFEIPFNSKRKWQLVIIKMKENKDGTCKYRLIMKGASEILIKKCDKIMNGKEAIPLNEEEMKNFQNSCEHFGTHGRRVIGFVQTEFDAPANIEFSEKSANFPQDELTFLGTCAIMDPPRDETPAAIRMCREAGIKVFMVTGDHHTTAKAIAQQIGLIDDKPRNQIDWEIVYGEEIPHLTDKDWDRLIARNSLVFSRTTPEQKLLIVEQCQKRKHIIAMTGDGVNDAPALKKSDIGVGMGSGSDVAKQASDIILTDDNFASIVAAIQEGRLMFDNIKKLMSYILTHLVPEVWGILVHYCFGMPIGQTSLQILSIDLGTEIPPGIAMCKEPAEDDIMKRPPRRPDKVVISRAMIGYCYTIVPHIQTVACFLAYWYIFWSHNINLSDLWMSTTTGHWKADGLNFTSNGRTFSVEEQLYINRQACSAWQVGIVFGQVFHIYSTRSLRQSMFKHGFFSNKSATISVVIEILLLLAYVYMPGVNEFIGGAPIPIGCWIITAVFGVIIFGINEIRKYYIRKMPHNKIVRLFKF